MPVDLLDPSMAANVTGNRRAGVHFEKAGSGAIKERLKTAEDGRLIVHGDDAKAGGKRARDFADMTPKEQEGERQLEAMGVADDYKEDDEGGGDNDDEEPADNRGKRMRTNERGDKGKKRAETGPYNDGGKFRAKKAFGDVKKSGQADPYAYMPLSAGHLNKRNKAQTGKEIRSYVQKAQNLKGAKAKRAGYGNKEGKGAGEHKPKFSAGSKNW